MNKYYIAVSLLSSLAVAILGVLVYENGRLDPKTKHKFYNTYIVVIMANMAELLAVLLNGAPENTIFVHAVIKAMDYILSPAAAVFFIMQIYDSKSYKKVFAAGLTVDIILQIASIFTGWTFYIDSNNYYQHGPLYFVYAGIYSFALISVVVGFVKYGKNYKKENLLSLTAITFYILTAILLQEAYNIDVRTCCLALTIGAILQYIHFIEFNQQLRDEAFIAQKNLLEKDPLTGLYNRYSYEEHLKIHKNSEKLPEDLVVVSIDVNGLKVINDTLGHVAGDELITGVASVIAETFDPYGTTFRTGGDEFMALINCEAEAVAGLKEAFNNNLASWQGNIVKELSASLGCVRAGDYPGATVEQLATVADDLMYTAKENYYKARGIDRTGRKAAFEALNKFYEKILKVNLKEDSFGVLRAEESELTAEKGYTDTFSGWFTNFANSPNLYPSDYSEFVEKTDLAYIKRHFDIGNKYLSIHYRRFMRGEYRPAIMEMIAAEDYAEDNQIVFLYVKDIGR